jgi:hypothetical protein
MCSTARIDNVLDTELKQTRKKKTRKPYKDPVRLYSQTGGGFFTGLFTIWVSSTLSYETHVSRGGCHLSGLYNDTQHTWLLSLLEEGPKHKQTTARTTRVNETPLNTFFAWRHTKVNFFYSKDNATTRATTGRGDHRITGYIWLLGWQ